MRLLGLALLALVSTGMVQDEGKKREMKDRKWIEGEIVCIGCSLAKEHGVDAQCTLHSKHAQGLLDKKGKIWTIVANARGHNVISNRKLRGKEVRVYGWSYKKHQYLELWKYEVRHKNKWIGWDYCKT